MDNIWIIQCTFLGPVNDKNTQSQIERLKFNLQNSLYMLANKPDLKCKK